MARLASSFKACQPYRFDTNPMSGNFPYIFRIVGISRKNIKIPFANYPANASVNVFTSMAVFFFAAHVAITLQFIITNKNVAQLQFFS